jgi:hypothetical protein
LAAERTTITNVIAPTNQGVACYAELAGIYSDAYHALEPIYARLAKLGSA